MFQLCHGTQQLCGTATRTKADSQAAWEQLTDLRRIQSSVWCAMSTWPSRMRHWSSVVRLCTSKTATHEETRSVQGAGTSESHHRFPRAGNQCSPSMFTAPARTGTVQNS
jgi:hypothetical protein